MICHQDGGITGKGDGWYKGRRLMILRMRTIVFLLCLLLFFLCPILCCFAQTVRGGTTGAERLIVGVTHDPPYLIKEKNGEWTGRT